MNAAASRQFSMMVNQPRSYLGRAELRVGPDIVTLVARPIRHYRAIVLSYICVAVVLVLLAALPLNLPGSLELRSVVVGVICGALAGGIFWLLRSSEGTPRLMRLPLTVVSLTKRKGRVLVVSGAFDDQVRSGRWTLVAGSRADAEEIAAALTTGRG